MGVEWWAGEHAHQHRSGAVAAVAAAADYGPQPTGRPRVPQHGARVQHHLQPRHRHQAVPLPVEQPGAGGAGPASSPSPSPSPGGAWSPAPATAPAATTAAGAECGQWKARDLGRAGERAQVRGVQRGAERQLPPPLPLQTRLHQAPAAATQLPHIANIRLVTRGYTCPSTSTFLYIFPFTPTPTLYPTYTPSVPKIHPAPRHLHLSPSTCDM